MSVGVVSNTLMQDLTHIVGSGNVVTGPRTLDVYAQGGGKTADLIRVMPETAEDVAAIVNLSREHGQKVFSVRGNIFPDALEGQSGILIDPVNLNKIEKIDTRNLMAHIGAGVTFEQLEKELAKQDVGLLMPASAESPYVVRSYIERDCLVGSVTYRQPNLSIFHAIMAGGHKWFSGTQQMVQNGANFREDEGPQISPIFGGSEDSFGIPVFGIVYIYPRKKERQIFAYNFNKLEDALEFTYKVSRNEHCFEIAGGDDTWWSSLTGKAMDLANWTVLMSIEQHKKLVDNQAAQVAALAKDLGAKTLDKKITDALGLTLRRPWYIRDRAHIKGSIETVKYYTSAGKVLNLFDAAGNAVKGMPVGRCFIPVYFGASMFCELDLHHVQDFQAQAKLARLDAYAAVLDQRALIDRGNGKLAQMVYERTNPVNVTMVKNFKRMLDPDNLLNPGQLMEGI